MECKSGLGLTVAICSVITLAVLMRVTAHVNWDEAFARSTPTPPLPVPKADTGNA